VSSSTDNIIPRSKVALYPSSNLFPDVEMLSEGIALATPLISSLHWGDVVPMPTLPLLSILILSAKFIPVVFVQKVRLPASSAPLRYHRKVAVVLVMLDRLTFDGETANGRVLYRGRQAVVLQAPATVQLHPEHFVERLPSDFKLYWNHLNFPGRQFELPFDS
jgi:hypothetical protein